jgi:hypothetical protein
MGIKPTSVIRLHNNMDSKELDQNITKIKGFKDSGSHMLRARVTNLGRNKVTIFEVYKSTFSDRSLIKLEKLKNIILNKNLSINKMLTKGIKEGQSIKIKKFESFINDKKKFVEHLELSPKNSPFEADQMFPQKKTNNTLENYRAQTHISNPKEFKENASLNELMEVANKLGLENITMNYLESAADIRTESHKNNQKELKPIIQDDDLMKMLEIIEDDKMSVQDFQSEFQKQTQNINPKSIAETTIDTELKKLEDEFDLHDISLDDLNNEEKITEQTQKKNPHEKGITLQILDDEPMLMGISDENELISHSAVEITTSDIGPPPPTDDIGPPPPTDDPGPPPPTDDPGPPPTKVDPDLVKRRELLNLLKDMGLR